MKNIHVVLINGAIAKVAKRIFLTAAMLLILSPLTLVLQGQIIVNTMTELHNRLAEFNAGSAHMKIAISADFDITEVLSVHNPGYSLSIISYDPLSAGDIYTLTRGVEGDLFTVTGGSTLTLANITIDGNRTSLAYGSGITNGSLVHVGVANLYGTLNMDNGATLRNNFYNVNGAGVYIDSTGTFNMSGGHITDNRANGSAGGVYIQIHGGTFNMSGGEIYGNYCGGSAASYAGGVHFPGGGGGGNVFRLGGTAKIYDNYKNNGSQENNVYVGSGRYIVLGTGAPVPPPATGMKIYITKTANNGVFVNSGANLGHLAYFWADDPEYTVILTGASNNQLKVTSDYLIEIDPSTNKIFDEVLYGYPPQTPYEVTVLNKGIPTGDLVVTISGENPDDFTLSKTSIPPLGVLGTDTFTIVPKTGLAAGTYTAFVVVRAQAGNLLTRRFDVSFKVTSKPFCGGEGTQTEPYQICNAEQLDSVRYFLDKHFILAADITLSGDWLPIGDENAVFTGTLNGNGYSISGLHVTEAIYVGWDDYENEWSAYAAGLFAALDGAEISNLTLNNPVIDINVAGIYDWAGHFAIGTVAGKSYGAQIRNMVINNPTVLKYIDDWETNFFGGVVGYALESSQLNSTGLYMNIINGVEIYSGKIEFTDVLSDRSENYLGGIAGANSKSVIVNAAVYGTEIGTEYAGTEDMDYLYVGGIAGYTSAESLVQESSCILNSITTAKIKIPTTLQAGYYPEDVGVGGICGWVYKDAVVNTVYIGDLDDLFGIEESGIYTISHNHNFDDVPTAYAADIVTTLNDKTPGTGGFWMAAKVIDDDTPYGFEGAMAKLKSWNYKEILGIANTPYMGMSEMPLTQLFCGGEGTPLDPYQICNAAQLDSIRYFMDKHFVLNKDINVQDGTFSFDYTNGWEPIGFFDMELENIPFTGTLNGKGHKVYNLWIDRDEDNSIGLFGCIGNGAHIDSLGVEIDAVRGITGAGVVGGLVGYSYDNSTISNCYVTGKVEGYSSVGGLLGAQENASVLNCYANVSVKGDGWVGGLVGDNYISSIANCYAIGDVQVFGVHELSETIGGLAGINENSTITNCYATGNVKGVKNIGGLVGYNVNATISNCVAANSILSGNVYANRIVGYNNDATLTNNYANSAMMVNGGTVSGTLGDENGADEVMTTLKTFDFYNSSSNWYGGAWSIDKESNPSKIWKICNKLSLPFFQWQNIACATTGFITDIEIENCPENGWLHLDAMMEMQVKITPEDAPDQEVIWKSSNPNTVTVDQYGLVKALKIGRSIITATTVDGGFIAECHIFVIHPVASVVLNKTAITLQVEDEETLIATILPENANIKEVVWESDDEAVATVDDNGKVTAVGVGTATITVTTLEGGFTATCIVTVVETYVVPTGITVTPMALNLDSGDVYELSATVKPAGANPNVTWSSSNAAIAEVDGNGVVTAKAAGKATITVKTVNGYSATCAVTVVIPVESVDVTPAECIIPLKGAKALKATVNPSNATNKTITWSSSNTAIATVSSTGTVTAKSVNGEVEIYATAANGVVGICVVTVGTGKSLPVDAETDEITVYPNPTNGELRITNYELGITNIEIFDMLGRPVGANLRVCPTANDETVINISHLPTGVYFIRIETENGKIVTRKVVKN